MLCSLGSKTKQLIKLKVKKRTKKPNRFVLEEDKNCPLRVSCWREYPFAKTENEKLAILLLAWWNCVFSIKYMFLQMKGGLKWGHVPLLALFVGKGLESLKIQWFPGIFSLLIKVLPF